MNANHNSAGAHDDHVVGATLSNRHLYAHGRKCRGGQLNNRLHGYDTGRRGAARSPSSGDPSVRCAPHPHRTSRNLIAHQLHSIYEVGVIGAYAHDVCLDQDRSSPSAFARSHVPHGVCALAPS